MERFVIITGLSGSGKSLAGNCLEDIGFFCVDNLPVQLMPPFFDLIRNSAPPIERAALVVDVREAAFLAPFPAILEQVRSAGAPIELVFFECSDEVQKRRFSETRRPHPMSLPGATLDDAIRSERALLAGIRAEADRIIDTSKFTAHQLRAYLKSSYGADGTHRALTVNVMSFGFKYGLPLDADLVFDVRFLPNPYFVEELRSRTGLDEPVRRFVADQPDAVDFRRRLHDMIDFLLPRYIAEDKSYLTVAIGCTGGKHRSVALSEALAGHLREGDQLVHVSHRDLGRE